MESNLEFEIRKNIERKINVTRENLIDGFFYTQDKNWNARSVQGRQSPARPNGPLSYRSLKSTNNILSSPHIKLLHYIHISS